MKRLTLTLSAVVVTAFCFGQKVEVTEGGQSIGGGSNNALSVVVYGAKASDVEHDIKSFMKKHKAKFSSKKGELFGDDAVVKEFGDNTCDIYAKVIPEGKEDVKLIVAFDLGGAFLSSSQHSKQFAAAKNMIRKIGVDGTKAAVGAVVKEEEKTLEKLNKEQEDLVKNKEKLEKDIEQWKKDIENAEKEIEENKKSQEEKAKEIGSQEKVVEEVKKKMESIK